MQNRTRYPLIGLAAIAVVLIPTTLYFRMAANAERDRVQMARQAGRLERDRADELKALAEAAARSMQRTNVRSISLGTCCCRRCGC